MVRCRRVGAYQERLGILDILFDGKEFITTTQDTKKDSHLLPQFAMTVAANPGNNGSPLLARADSRRDLERFEARGAHPRQTHEKGLRLMPIFTSMIPATQKMLL